MCHFQYRDCCCILPVFSNFFYYTLPSHPSLFHACTGYGGVETDQQKDSHKEMSSKNKYPWNPQISLEQCSTMIHVSRAWTVGNQYTKEPKYTTSGVKNLRNQGVVWSHSDSVDTSLSSALCGNQDTALVSWVQGKLKNSVWLESILFKSLLKTTFWFCTLVLALGIPGLVDLMPTWARPSTDLASVCSLSG